MNWDQKSQFKQRETYPDHNSIPTKLCCRYNAFRRKAFPSHTPHPDSGFRLIDWTSIHPSREPVSFVTKGLHVAARPWKPRKCTSLWVVFFETIVLDALWNSWIINDIGFVCFFFEFLLTALVSLLVSWVCLIEDFSDNHKSPSTPSPSIWKCLIL